MSTSDIERKVHTIIRNSCRLGRTPTVDDLCIKTGRDRDGLSHTLNKLAKDRKIRWINSNEVVILPLPSWYVREKRGRFIY